MSETRCPSCGAALRAVDLITGWCDGCGKKIPAFVQSAARGTAARTLPRPALDDPEFGPAPAPYRAPDFRRRRLWGALVVVVLLALVAAGVGLYYWFKTDVEITVDNGASEPATVFLDGVESLTVPGRQAAVLSCRSGRHKISVARGGKTVFDEVKDLQGGERESRKYLLNPEADNRYWVRTVEYGFSVPRFTTYYNDADRYQQSAAEIHLAPAGAWVDEKTNLVLKPPPEKVEGYFSDSRTVLTRISREDYDLIAAAAKKQEVSSDDVSRMEALVERLLKSGQ